MRHAYGPSFTKLDENCGLPDFFTDYQIRHLGNPSGLPGILLKIDPCYMSRIFLNNPVREPPERRLHEPCGMLLEECQAPKQDGMWHCENTVRVVPH